MDFHDDLSAVLPITRSAEGVWEQKCSYSQPDMHDELTVELDGPFGSVASAETEVIKFAVVGERNAGKSTLLQALVNSRDRNWLRLTSLLPVLSGTFVNARFGTPGPCVPGEAPRDELPFLDTDVATTVLLVTREDFGFFCREFGVEPPTPLKQATLFVALQFVEFGGDHLDSMMELKITDPVLLSATMEKSLATLQKSEALAYFVNASSLVVDGRLDKEQWGAMIKRLVWLSAQMLPPRELTVYVSRLGECGSFQDPGPSIEAILGTADKQMTAEILLLREDEITESEVVDDETERVLAATRADGRGTVLTRTIAALLKTMLPLRSVRCARHVDPGHGSSSKLNIPGLFSIVVSLFHSAVTPSTADSDSSLLAAEMLRCCVRKATTVVDEFDPWVQTSDLAAYLDEQAEDCCGTPTTIPPQHALSRWGALATTLVDRGILVDDTQDEHYLAVEISGVRRVLTLAPVAPLVRGAKKSGCYYAEMNSKTTVLTQRRFRAPLTGPHRRLVERCVDNGLISCSSTEECLLPTALREEHARALLALGESICDAALRSPPIDDALWLARDMVALQRLHREPGDSRLVLTRRVTPTEASKLAATLRALPPDEFGKENPYAEIIALVRIVANNTTNTT